MFKNKVYFYASHLLIFQFRKNKRVCVMALPTVLESTNKYGLSKRREVCEKTFYFCGIIVIYDLIIIVKIRL